MKKDIQIFLNHRPMSGAILIEYTALDRDHEISEDEYEDFERKYHRCPILAHVDLRRIYSNSLKRLAEKGQGYWNNVSEIRFFTRTQ